MKAPCYETRVTTIAGVALALVCTLAVREDSKP